VFDLCKKQYGPDSFFLEVPVIRKELSFAEEVKKKGKEKGISRPFPPFFDFNSSVFDFFFFSPDPTTHGVSGPPE